MDLKDLTELVINNKDCVVLKVKENHEIDLIAFGMFNGDKRQTSYLHRFSY